jgi:hypothetical protein
MFSSRPGRQEKARTAMVNRRQLTICQRLTTALTALTTLLPTADNGLTTLTALTTPAALSVCCRRSIQEKSDSNPVFYFLKHFFSDTFHIHDLFNLVELSHFGSVFDDIVRH